MERGYVQGLPKFFGYPYYCSRGRIVRESRKFSGYPYGAENFCRPGPFCRNVKNSQCTCSFISMHKLVVTPETSYEMFSH